MSMQSNQRMIVRIVACGTVATGLFVLFRFGLPSHWRFFTHLSRSVEMAGPFYTAAGAVVMLIPILKLVAGVGLFRNNRWAWFSTIALLTTDFAFRAAGAINMSLIALFVPPAPLPPQPEGSVTIVIRYWPSYVIGIISIASVLVLIQKPIRTLFHEGRSA